MKFINYSLKLAPGWWSSVKVIWWPDLLLANWLNRRVAVSDMTAVCLFTQRLPPKFPWVVDITDLSMLCPTVYPLRGQMIGNIHVIKGIGLKWVPSLVPRPCTFIACSTIFAQRAWARSSLDVCCSLCYGNFTENHCCLRMYVYNGVKLKQVKRVRYTIVVSSR